ncbi:MAG: hypothetical protein GC155_14305 [Alphaproteobacteria bacterium]|nr:hypothetical protein [Alphaproteobacteria bacterium]
MSQTSVIGTKDAFRTTLAALRFLVTDRIGLVGLLWAVLAFVVRPALLSIHHGGGGDVGAFLRESFDPLSLSQLVGGVQWVCFAGCLVIVAMAHVRYSATAGALSERARFMVSAGYAAVLAGAYLVFLWGPVSVFTLMMHDSFIFFDSTHRVLQGQTPSVDFPTPLGAVAIYLPALAAKLIGGYAGSVELASAAVALLLGLACAWASMRRFPTAVSVLLVVSIFLVATPATLLDKWGGDSFTFLGKDAFLLTDNLTWAMFYNRWAWAGLIAAFAFLAPPVRPAAPAIAEIAVLAAILAFLFYLKLTYFIVAGAGAVIYATTNPRPLRTLGVGAGLSLAIVLLVGVATGTLTAYLGDVFAVTKVSGNRSGMLFLAIRRNLTDILLATTPMAVLAASRNVTTKDVAVGGFMLVASIFVINQNAQYTGICSLISLGAYGVSRVWAVSPDRMSCFAAMGSFLMLAASPLLSGSMTMMDQVSAARREEVRPAAEWSDVLALKGVYIAERESALAPLEKAATPERRRELLPLIGALGRRQDLRQGEYMHVVMAGVADLRGAMRPGDSIVTLAMSNPFPALLDARDAKGASLSLQSNRTVDDTTYPKPEDMFRDADHVMIPRVSMVSSTSELMNELYGSWLTAHYEEHVDSAYWSRWSRRKSADDASSSLETVGSR